CHQRAATDTSHADQKAHAQPGEGIEVIEGGELAHADARCARQPCSVMTGWAAMASSRPVETSADSRLFAGLALSPFTAWLRIWSISRRWFAILVMTCCLRVHKSRQ